jgi:hypothetical protein
VSEIAPCDLGRFQDAFAAALRGAPEALAPWLDPNAATAGLSVYRNTVAKGLADTIAGRFPTVERAVGEAWLRAAALAFAEVAPPTRPELSAWGDAFPDWLAAFPPATELPYLPALARLDGYWLEAYLAADAPALAATAFSALDETALRGAAARLHPSARVAWFADGAAELWRRLRPPTDPPAELELSEAPGGMLLVRPGEVVELYPLGVAGFAFLTACADRRSLAECAATALQAEPAAPFAQIFADLIAVGAFAALQPAAH